MTLYRAIKIEVQEIHSVIIDYQHLEIYYIRIIH